MLIKPIKEVAMMYKKSWFKLSCASLVVVTLLLAAAGPLSAQAPVVAGASCYSRLRADLGTVLPSGWSGYRQQSACQAARANVAEAVPVLLPAAGSTSANASACFRALKQDLGTVLPGRASNPVPGACRTR